MTMVMRKPIRGLLVEMTVSACQRQSPRCVARSSMGLTLSHRERKTFRQTTMRVAQGVLQLRDLALIILAFDIFLDNLQRPLDGLQSGVQALWLVARAQFPCELVMALFCAAALGGQSFVEVVDGDAHVYEPVVQVGELGFVRLERRCGRFVGWVL